MLFLLLLLCVGFIYFVIFLSLPKLGQSFQRTRLGILRLGYRPMKDAEVAAFAHFTGVEFFVYVRAVSGKLRATFSVVTISAKTECVVVGIGVLTLSYFAFLFLSQNFVKNKKFCKILN